MEKKLISIVAGCYNEEENIDELYRQVCEAMLPYQDRYAYEILFMDNASADGSVKKIKSLIEKDKNVRLIVNARNFGHIRSAYYGYLQSRGDAIVNIAVDLQDPPILIRKFIDKWDEGFKVVLGVKTNSKDSGILFLMRKLFYFLMARLSEVEQVKNFTGFGLYDKAFIDVLRKLEIPYPYFRGLVAEMGFSRAEIPYVQPRREKGKTKNNFYTLYDLAMLGFVNHSKLPLRLASFFGFGMSLVSFLSGVIYLVYKLLFWDRFQGGVAPLMIGFFFMGGVQLFFLGVIGEYIGSIYTQVMKMPLVIEKERANF